MRTSTLLSGLALSFLTLPVTSIPARSAGIEPTGAELRVDDPAIGRVRSPAATFSPDGRALITWTNLRDGVRGMFLASGERLLGEDLTLAANSELPSNPGSGRFVSRHDPFPLFVSEDEFLLFWTEEDSIIRLGIFHYDIEVLDRDVFAQRFTAAGEAIGEPFAVNSDRTGLQFGARAARLDETRLLVVWESDYDLDASLVGIFGQVLDLAGNRLGPEIRIEQQSLSRNAQPALAVNGAGQTLITWIDTDTDDSGIVARLFGPSMTPLSDELRINQRRRNSQSAPAVTAVGEERFFVAWQSYVNHDERWRIHGRAIDASGPLGAEVRISGSFGQLDNAATLAATSDGTILAMWLNWVRPFPVLIAGVELDQDGAPLGEIFQVNEQQPGAQGRMGLAVGSNGELLATWEGFSDGKDLGVAARPLAELDRWRVTAVPTLAPRPSQP